MFLFFFFPGVCTIPFVLTEDWPHGFILEWGEHTTQTLPGPCDQHHGAHERLDGSEECILLGEHSPLEEMKGRGQKKVAL